jgi:2-haloacid dehalogenase
MERSRPRAVAFDVIETLFSLGPVAERLEAHGLDASSLERFFVRLLRDGFVLACTGRHRTFPDIAAATLEIVAPTLDGTARSDVLAGFEVLQAHADVRPALEALRAGGVRIAALTNGSARLTAHLLEANDIHGYFERVISADEVRVWKPRPEPYLHAAETLGLEPADVAMVAVHAWDTHGARCAGLTTGWASRLEGTYSNVLEPPHVSGDDLTAVATGLLSLPTS